MYPWQRGHMERIRTLHRGDRLPHALLLRGPRNLGKRDFAFEVARYVLCRNPNHGNDREKSGACGECEECKLNAAGTHPDLKVIEPVDSKLIRIEQIRDLIEWTGQTPQRGGARTVVIEPAEQMNVYSANALLKCLEEPGANTLIMLVTAAPGKLLPTIRSRCQQFDFAIPRTEEALTWLASNETLSGIDLPLMLAVAGGAPLAVVNDFDETFLARRTDVATAVGKLLEGESPLAVARTLSAGDVDSDLAVVYSLYADALRLSLTGDENIIKNKDLADLARRLSNSSGRRNLFASADAVSRARIEAQSPSNPNIQLLIESLMITLAGNCGL